jgi:hypothetical protein
VSREEEIRLIAYAIWQREGCPHGKDCDHWLQAEVVWEVQHKPEVVSASAPSPTVASPKPVKKGTQSKKHPD